jgi:glutamate racemase
MWVPLIENNEHNSVGADFFVKKNLDQLLSADPQIDSIILACTHYPLLIPKIRQFLPQHIQIISQGAIVASSLKDYLHRHPEMESRCRKDGNITYYSTESADKFKHSASVFLQEDIQAINIRI